MDKQSNNDNQKIPDDTNVMVMTTMSDLMARAWWLKTKASITWFLIGVIVGMSIMIGNMNG